MAGKPQTLSRGQKSEVTWLLWKQILAVSLVILALLGGIIGYSLWESYVRLEQKLETLVAKQFEEPHIQNVVSNVAETKAEALLIEQINPEVKKFKAEINSQLEEIQTITAKIETLKSQSDSNAEQIEKILFSVRSSQKEFEKAQKAILSLHSDLVKIKRLIIEIEYFTYFTRLGRGLLGHPFHEKRIENKLNELLMIAIPDPQERSEFLNFLQATRPSPPKD